MELGNSFVINGKEWPEVEELIYSDDGGLLFYDPPTGFYICGVCSFLDQEAPDRKREDFIAPNADAIIRHIAEHMAYDDGDDWGKPEMNAVLKNEVEVRLAKKFQETLGVSPEKARFLAKLLKKEKQGGGEE